MNRIVKVDVAPAVSVRIEQSDDQDATLAAAARDGGDPYAHILWPAALAAAAALARIIAADATVRDGEATVLDVGAGTGLCAVTAAVLGVRAIAIDRDARALERIGRTAAMNGVRVDTRSCDIFTDALPACTVAVFADLLYERPLAERVAGLTTELLQRRALVIVADPQRTGRAAFEAALARQAVAVVWVPQRIQPPDETMTTVDVAVFRPQ